MTKLSDLEKKWEKRPGFKPAFNALEDEYAIMEALYLARAKSGLSQAELARKMKTTQSAIARLESGKAHPSTRTLWKLAAATGTRLKITFEPIEKRGRS